LILATIRDIYEWSIIGYCNEGDGSGVKRNRLSSVLVLTALFVASPAVAQEAIPFRTTRDKKLLAEVKVDGKERTLVLDTGAVDLILDISAVGMKLSDLKQAGPWNPNGSLKTATRRVDIEIAGKKFTVLAAILDCKPVSEIAGVKVEGIIGMVVFEHFKKVSFDFENSKLELK
jgi:hypothetical protein